ncbi:MAG: hypothetical protein ACI857_000288 [Arenicella sp.]|jgi:hypothetical protein
MAKNENKTQMTEIQTSDYLKTIPDEGQKADCIELDQMIQDVTGRKPKMWGKEIVGFGCYHYVGKSGREGDWFKTGYAPRKNQLSIYCIGGFDNHQDILDRLGKHKLGKGCLYVKNLEAVDKSVLKELLLANMEVMDKEYPE